MKRATEDPLSQNEIAAEAYRLWEARGKPSGQDVAFWLEAERRLSGRAKPAPQEKLDGVSRLIRSRARDPEARRARTVHDGE